ncbi:GlxA family transcriptional regulator [Ruegeria jejuensis]|uniref:GlxA family transcriptional regulator n=1 Tax=Ruegeria jejuensis TaxID=3233338 RepID=UPI00355C0BC2
MQQWQKSSSRCQSFGVLLFDGFSNHCLANSIEPLRAANMLSGKTLYEWRFLSLDAGSVTSSSGLRVAPHARLSDEGGDLLMVMPSYGFRNYLNWPIGAALRSAAGRFSTLVGLDTGSWLLAEAGLLTDLKATIHWEELTGFAERFPETEVLRERFVIDGNRITCSGAMAAFDLVMHLIGRDHGQALALEVAQLFMTRDSARSHASSGTSAPVNRALAAMQANLEQPLAIPDIAAQARLTQKALEVRMKAELGAGPARVYRRMRLNLARKMVSETDLPVSEIAVRAGYENASAMTRAFGGEFGQSPSEMRKKRL